MLLMVIDQIGGNDNYLLFGLEEKIVMENADMFLRLPDFKYNGEKLETKLVKSDHDYVKDYFSSDHNVSAEEMYSVKLSCGGAVTVFVK